MRNTLVSQCFHSNLQRMHKSIFELFPPFLLEDGKLSRVAPAWLAESTPNEFTVGSFLCLGNFCFVVDSLNLGWCVKLTVVQTARLASKVDPHMTKYDLAVFVCLL